MPFADLSPETAADMLAANAPALIILDVRTAPEFERHRIAGARLVPVQDLARRTHELDPDAAYLVVCEHGIRSVAACEFLSGRDFDDLRNLRGGMAHWIAAGLPVDRGPSA